VSCTGDGHAGSVGCGRPRREPDPAATSCVLRALECLRNEPAERLSPRRLAQHLDVSHQAPYVHFGDAHAGDRMRRLGDSTVKGCRWVESEKVHRLGWARGPRRPFAAPSGAVRGGGAVRAVLAWGSRSRRCGGSIVRQAIRPWRRRCVRGGNPRGHCGARIPRSCAGRSTAGCGARRGWIRRDCARPRPHATGRHSLDSWPARRRHARCRPTGSLPSIPAHSPRNTCGPVGRRKNGTRPRLQTGAE